MALAQATNSPAVAKSLSMSRFSILDSLLELTSITLLRRTLRGNTSVAQNEILFTESIRGQHSAPPACLLLLCLVPLSQPVRLDLKRHFRFFSRWTVAVVSRKWLTTCRSWSTCLLLVRFSFSHCVLTSLFGLSVCALAVLTLFLSTASLLPFDCQGAGSPTSCKADSLIYILRYMYK